MQLSSVRGRGDVDQLKSQGPVAKIELTCMEKNECTVHVKIEVSNYTHHNLDTYRAHM